LKSVLESKLFSLGAKNKPWDPMGGLKLEFTLLHWYKIFIPEAEVDSCKFRMHLFPAKVGAKYTPGLTQPPRMPNFQ
jgi:hypothetical protein